jgi:hypothetical protein
MAVLEKRANGVPKAGSNKKEFVVDFCDEPTLVHVSGTLFVRLFVSFQLVIQYSFAHIQNRL